MGASRRGRPAHGRAALGLDDQLAREPLAQLRNAGDEELVLFIYGAPPERGQAEFFEDVPD